MLEVQKVKARHGGEKVRSLHLHASSFSRRRAVRRANNALGAMSWKETEGVAGRVARQAIWLQRVIAPRSLSETKARKVRREEKARVSTSPVARL